MIFCIFFGLLSVISAEMFDVDVSADTVNINPDCFLPSYTGPCKALLPRFYYDWKRKECDTFYYGGCDGNSNNFRTLGECKRSCPVRIKVDCSLPSETGPCRAAIPRYFYNSKLKRCDKFIYGGCRGNSNNFESHRECERTCGGLTYSDVGDSGFDMPVHYGTEDTKSEDAIPSGNREMYNQPAEDFDMGQFL